MTQLPNLEAKLVALKCPTCEDYLGDKEDGWAAGCKDCQGTGLRFPTLVRVCEWGHNINLIGTCECGKGTDESPGYLPDVTEGKLLEILLTLGTEIELEIQVGSYRVGVWGLTKHDVRTHVFFGETLLEALAEAVLAKCN